MDHIREHVEKELEWLRALMEADVTAVAWQRKEDRRLSWWAASGTADQRYRTLMIRTGRGLEGTVPRIGRPLVLDASDPNIEKKREESSLMLVEGVHAAAAHPISGADGLCGVLFAGNRQQRVFKPEHLASLQLSARRLGQLRDCAEKGSPIPDKE